MLYVWTEFLYVDHLRDFNIHGSVHRNNILMYIQQDATLYSLFYLETALHGAQTTVSTASCICHTVIAICRYRGRV